MSMRNLGPLIPTADLRTAKRARSTAAVQSYAYDRDRGSQRERGYTRRWEKARLGFLREYPLCVHCEAQGFVTAATDVDHKIPHRGDMVLFWDTANWQPLCHSHHSQKTRAEGGRAFD
jgi:5-methylcytosine-specific restriction protein A